ncbi:MAG: hypothetical protein CSA32_01725 [Desulfobulbus propionicus]|nr:MAG: hypothetical protein CSA32_01725 [Desulfobulbus propionicus]
MGYKHLVNQNPVQMFNTGSEKNQLGLVMARAGLGKTAILVQIALNSILQGNKVIHVSIGESIEKTRLRYEDIIQVITEGQDTTSELLDLVNQNRMIMTFKESAFSRPRLEERLNDLVLQNIFKPNCLVVDGFDFVNADRSIIEDMKEFTEQMSLQSWFSAISHRDDDRFSPTGVPAPCHEIDDFFDSIILLKPESDATIQLEVIRNSGEEVDYDMDLRLDPTTMLVIKA